jgi:hypothetical protein
MPLPFRRLLIMNSYTHFQNKAALDTANATKRKAETIAPHSYMTRLNKRASELQEDVNRLEAQIDEINVKKTLCFATLLTLEEGEDGIYHSELISRLNATIDAPIADYIQEALDRREIERTYSITAEEYVYHVTRKTWLCLGY